MDIAALSIEISQLNLSNKVGIELAKMAKEQIEQTGEQLVELVKTSAPAPAEVHLGSNFDALM